MVDSGWMVRGSVFRAFSSFMFFFLQLEQRPSLINSDASEIGTHLALALVSPAFPELFDNLFSPRLNEFCPLLSNWLTRMIKRLIMALLTSVIWISPSESVIGALGCSGLDLAVWGLEKKALNPSFLINHVATFLLVT
jgi:hypothetical protein